MSVTNFRNNVKVLFVAGLIFNFVLGVFEIMFPFYLSYKGVSLVDMGIIFSVSTLVISLSRILIGEYSDIHGRKRLYLTGCSLGVLSSSLFPFSTDKTGITFSKILYDLHDQLRFSVHDIMLYENAREAYAKLLSWFTGVNFIVQAIGNLFLSILLIQLGYSGSFFLLAGIQATAFITLLLYREDRREHVERKFSLKEAYSFNIQKDLKILYLSSAIGALGFGIAHGFLLPLYFSAKYNLDTEQISVVTAIHRLSFLTTPMSDRVIGKLGVRRTYIVTTGAYVFAFLTIGLFTFPLAIFLPIFLVHDLIGGGIQMTAMSVIMQSSSEDERRGRNINILSVIQTPMTILAPTVASILAATNWDLIFIVGGSLYLISLLVFCFLSKAEPKQILV